MTTKFIAGQSARIRSAFSHEPKTMLQVARETGVERANVCWEVHDLREDGSVHLVRRGICPISRSRAGFYTTNPNGWYYFLSRFADTIKNLQIDTEDDPFLMVCQAVKSYYESNYDSARTIVPPAVQEHWEKTLKPLIDREVQR